MCTRVQARRLRRGQRPIGSRPAHPLPAAALAGCGSRRGSCKGVKTQSALVAQVDRAQDS